MKYLKSFNESIHSQPIENEYWKFVPPTDPQANAAKFVMVRK